MVSQQSRVDSVLNASTIGVDIEGVSKFELSSFIDVSISVLPELPNIRLGKQIERVFSFLIESASNYSILRENIQIIDDKVTIGELDFIIKNNESHVISHLEIVYKFYLYDPNYSEVELEKWIGPNKKDSFIEKYNKLALKQFPLLYKPKTAEVLKELNINDIKQELCFMSSLFVPFTFLNQTFSKINNAAICGYWISLKGFSKFQELENRYYLPDKHEWGVTPNNNSEWYSFSEIELKVNESISRNFSPLCWIKTSELVFEQCFIVWW